MATALADAKGDLISFPEFSTSIKASHSVHVVARLAAWVKTIWTSLGHQETQVLQILGCLQSLQLVDQAKFPFITGESGSSDLAYGEVFSKTGDFKDLMWLADTLNHGYCGI